jgi:hypothetical protein
MASPTTPNAPTTSSPPARQAAAEAVELLRPHIADDPAFAAICETLSTTEPDTTEPDVDDADKIAKALIESDRIRKDENLPKETRDLADRGHRALQLEELAKVNPSEAWKYEQRPA